MSWFEFKIEDIMINCPSLYQTLNYFKKKSNFLKHFINIYV